MADSLLHITIARQVVCHRAVPHSITQLASQFPDDYALGSVLFDLPFYDRLLVTGINTLRHKPLRYHPFGQAVHLVDGAALCSSLFTRATTNAQLATALGALTHFAVDIVFHKEIEAQIRDRDVSHDELEREMGLHCHYDLLGHSGVGTSYARDAAFLLPTSGWSEFAVSAFHPLIAQTPTARTFSRWQRSFRAFGWLYSKSVFPWLKTLPPDHPPTAATSLTLLDESIALAASFLIAANEHLSPKESKENLKQKLPAKRMSDGNAA